MTRKEIVLKIEEMLSKGITKRKIFSELDTKCDAALYLSAIPDYEMRSKYKFLNSALAGIIFYYAAIRLIMNVFIIISLGTTM
jgi:hypothetical protein